MIERWQITSRDEWLEKRKRYVGASESPALFGEHQYLTRLKLNVSKRGVEFPFEDNKVVRRGRWMEPAIGKAVAELRPDWEVTASTDFYYDDELRMSATPDFYVKAERGRGTLQTKSVAHSVWHNQYNDGTEAPLGVLIQASQEAMMSDAAFAAVAVMLVDPHAMDCKIFEFDRNPAVEDKIKEAIRLFWDDISNDREPEPDFAKDSEVIKALFPKEIPGSTLDLSGNNHVVELLDRRAWLMSRIKDDEANLDTINAEIQFLMRDHESAIGLPPGLRITYKSTDRAGYTVAPKTVRSLRVYDKREQAPL